MIPVISMVGKSNSGKTSVITRLVTLLKERGYRIAAIKHSAHGFQLEAEGKDSWRLAEAGSAAVMLSSPQRVALFQPMEREPDLEGLIYHLPGDIDLVLAEGFKKSRAVKIEVHRRELGPDLVSSPSELFAVVTDEPLHLSIPQYTPEDLAGLATALEDSFMLSHHEEDEVQLFVDGQPIFLKPYVQDVFSRVLLALLSTLKGVGVEGIKKADVRLRRRG